MTTDNIMDRIIRINFMRSYFGFFINTPYTKPISIEDLAFITENDFILIVTNETKNNGYPFDKEKVAKLLEVDKEYYLDFVNASQSNSAIRLREFPNDMFNAANFIVKEVKPKENGKKSR